MGSKHRAAITGAAGFIGSNLADRLLSEGWDVVGIDNLAYGVLEQVPSGVEFHRHDIRHDGLDALLKGADVVYHLAAKNCIADCQADPVETSDINITGTAKVFEAARRAGVPKIVYAESSAVYEGSAMLPTPETEMKPESFYALSKMAGGAIAEGYRRFHGMRMTGLRYFCVYGPRQDYRRTIPPVMSAFIIKLLRGERPFIFGSGDKRRDFIYVDDVNDFHLQAATDPATDGLIVNLGSGVSHSITEIYDAIARMLGTTERPDHRADQPGEAQETLADITLARSLGWAPRVSLEAGLAKQLAFIKEHVLAAPAGSAA
jgi:UDP-glucose 4-epimerase